MKWYKVENYTYVFSLRIKDSGGFTLCIEYDSSEKDFRLGWWDLRMVEPEDICYLNIVINTHEWILMIFTDDIEVE